LNQSANDTRTYYDRPKWSTFVASGVRYLFKPIGAEHQKETTRTPSPLIDVSHFHIALEFMKHRFLEGSVVWYKQNREELYALSHFKFTKLHDLLD